MIVVMFSTVLSCCLPNGVLFTLSLFFWLLAEGSQVPDSPGSFASVIGSVGLKDVDLSEDGSELAAKLYSLLTGD